MAFTSTQRVQIRRWLGFPSLFRYESILESAMDGVDVDTETVIVGWLSNLDTLETQLTVRYDQVEAAKVDELEIDTARGNLVLYREMRRYIGHISDALRTPPKRDVTVGAVPDAAGALNIRGT